MSTENNPVPGSDEHNAAMATLYREANGADPVVVDNQKDAAPQRPDHVPEKFWDAEKGTVNVDALLKSYTELEKTKSGPKDEETTKVEIEQQPEQPEQTEQSDEQKLVEKAGLNWEELGSKISEKGTLDDTDFAALEKQGIPRSVAEEYIAGVKARRDAAVSEAINYIGGKEATTELMTWASKTLPKQEIDAYNRMLNGPDWKVAVDTLKTKMGATRKNATESELEVGGGGPGSVTGYRAKSEMMKDMQDPRYKAGDKLFHQEVQRKIQFASWDLDR